MLLPEGMQPQRKFSLAYQIKITRIALSSLQVRFVQLTIQIANLLINSVVSRVSREHRDVEFVVSARYPSAVTT
jgi:hypothetical protein